MELSPVGNRLGDLSNVGKEADAVMEDSQFMDRSATSPDGD